MLSALKTAVGFFLVPIVLMLLFRNIEIAYLHLILREPVSWPRCKCAVLRIHDIVVRIRIHASDGWIRIGIRILFFSTLTFNTPKKIIF
jgi:hypothetical protein